MSRHARAELGLAIAIEPPGPIDFFTGNPSIEISTGKLHLFRTDRQPCKVRPPIADLMTKEGLILVGVLAIPSTISPVDYTSMIRSFDADIESMRILRLAHVIDGSADF
jgi:hypothetical protein